MISKVTVTFIFNIIVLSASTKIKQTLIKLLKTYKFIFPFANFRSQNGTRLRKNSPRGTLMPNASKDLLHQKLRQYVYMIHSYMI